jgi:YD repeat-containing protein
MRIKNLFILLLSVGFLATSVYFCKPKTTATGPENVQYFRSLLFSETPWDMERGSYSITADQAKSINNYKFTFDDNKRLLSVEYNRNGVLLDYSSMGAAKVTYEYKDSLQVKHFYNQNGEPIERDGAIVFEYTLDQNGMRTGMRFLDKEGKPVENRNKIHNWVWTKMPDGMIRELRYNLAGDSVVMNPFCPFYELRFSYNDKGYVTRLANFDHDTLYNCTAENCGDIGVSYFLFDLNDAGDVLQFSVHNTTGRMSNLYWGWSKRVNKVDENGNVTETAMFDQDDEYLGGKNVPVTQMVYDEHGAVLQRINMDKDRQVINSPADGVAYTAYTYDEQGRRTGTERLDKDKVKVEEKK